MNTRKWIGWIFKVIGIVVLLFVTVIVYQTCRPVKLNNLSLMTLNGEKADVDALLKDKHTILNFWATWCNPCIAEMPMLDTVYRQLDTTRWQMILVSDESVEKINMFRNKSSFSMPFMKLDQKMADIGIAALPKTIVVDGQKKIEYTKTGGITMTAKSFLEMLEKYE